MYKDGHFRSKIENRKTNKQTCPSISQYQQQRKTKMSTARSQAIMKLNADQHLVRDRSTFYKLIGIVKIMKT